MPTYDPRDDEPPDYEPDDNYCRPDPDEEPDYASYAAWRATQPRREWQAVPEADLPPYDDPFGE